MKTFAIEPKLMVRFDPALLSQDTIDTDRGPEWIRGDGNNTLCVPRVRFS